MFNIKLKWEIIHANYDRLISLKMPRYFLTPEKYNFDQK